MQKWQKETLDYEPPILESDGTPDGYIQRKNIQKIKATDDTPEQYECDMRFISVSEYEFLKAIQNIINGEQEVPDLINI